VRSQIARFLLCILHYWPENGPLRSKHVAKSKIKLLLVVLAAFIYLFTSNTMERQT